ncbi:hypothetical protein Ddye_012833 [Dipteronia dyeriana]|uniref:Retrotransposon gag domain-containing protein n=1 Tax=Dipteronia dyeriana TaxID=168575 RepID=A0AAE0CJ18_9ROSI|nr:hypothetical protein Ddye_012833 [Dipteronia dyeriana]
MKDRAKVWFISLKVGSLRLRDEVCQAFFNRFFPATKIKDIRVHVVSFLEEDNEPFHEAWGRYMMLLEQCPPYMVTEVYKVNPFYDGLMAFTQALVDNACGGALIKKSALEILKIYETLALNSQHRSLTSRK